MRNVLIDNPSQALSQPIQAGYGSSFFSRLRGLMFRRTLETNQGLLLVQAHEDRLDSAIHMFFMNFDLAVVWINKEWTVVDVKLAKRWRPFYQPAKPAKYVLEIHPEHLHDFKIGQKIQIQTP